MRGVESDRHCAYDRDTQGPNGARAAETSATSSSPNLSAARRTTAQLCEVRYVLQDAVRDARRCSSPFRISVRAVGQLVD
jgi:hypothetical protein